MSQKTSNDSLSTRIGFFQKIWLEVRLVLRLMKDSRVSPWIKILPLGAFLYWIIPDLVPGPIADGLVMWLGFYLFIELCPQNVVQEHRQALLKVIPGEWKPSTTDESDAQVVDAEYREED